MTRIAPPERRADIGTTLGLAALVLAMYWPALWFGLQWDDPEWYLQGYGRSLGDLLLQKNTYQFYRPLAIALNNLLVSPGGVVNATLAHAIQVAAHLANTLLVMSLLRRLGAGTSHARIAALLYAVHPLAYQAVAWSAPQQPIATLLTLLSILLAQEYLQRRQWHWLLLSASVFACGLLFQESVAPAVWVFVWLAWQDHARSGAEFSTAWRREAWVLPYAVAVLLYLGAWNAAPRAEGVTGSGFQGQVAAYLVQGALYPVSRLLGLLGATPRVEQMLALGFAAAAAALAAARHWRMLPEVAFGLLWVCAALLPPFVGLGWDYVQLAPRLLYPANLGAVLLWSLAPARALRPEASVEARALGAVVLVAVLVVSAEQYFEQHRLASLGTAHLESAVAEMEAQDGGRLLFINFPDRLQIRSQPYPYGFWGLVLAPVSQDLADFARAASGVQVQTRSLTAPEYGWDEREASPYRVDMRGERISHESLAAGAEWASVVLRSEYAPDGQMTLRSIGRIRADDGSPALARVGDRLELVLAQLGTPGKEGSTPLRLGWRPVARSVWGDTFFVHVLDEEGHLCAGADGDALGGMLPLVMWPAGKILEDERLIDLVDLPAGPYRITVGVYNRDSLERYAAASTVLPVAGQEITVGSVLVP